MKLSKEGIKELLSKTKDQFNALIAPPAAPPVAPAAAPATPPVGATVPVPCAYAVDGGANVFVDISDDNLPGIEAGDKVFSDATMTTPYPDGTYNITGTTFGFSVTTGLVASVSDPTGAGAGAPVVTTMAAPAVAPPVVPAVPVTVTASADAPPAAAKDLPTTPEAFRALYASFASGSTEDRLGNLEMMIKACMEYCFGYQIQQANAVQAVTVYKDELSAIQTQMAAQMTAHNEKMAKHVELTKGLFEMCEALVAEPAADPKTLSGKEKAQFQRVTAMDERLKKIADTLKKNKALA
jgi:hypothetical protein